MVKTKIYANENIVLSKLNDEIIFVKNKDRFKVLKTDYQTLKRAIDAIKKSGNLEDVYEEFLEEFDKDEIKGYIKSLIKEDILSTKKDTVAFKDNKVYLIKNSNLLKNLNSRFCEKNIKTALFKSVKEVDFSQVDTGKDILIFDGSNLTYKEILSFNKIMLEKKMPYLFLYKSGQSTIVGPMVIPWKTLCLECALTHHLDNLSYLSGGKISCDDIGEFKISNGGDLSPEYEDNSVLTQIILNEIEKYFYDKTNLLFLEKKFIFEKDFEESFKRPTRYTPNVNCKSCRAMNKNFQIIEKEEDLKEVESNKIHLNEVVYSKGGLRSKNFEEAKSIVERGLKNIGAEIKIVRRKDNVFDKIAPVFDSSVNIESLSNNRLIREQYSHGKGIDEKQAYLSASYELFERISSKYYGEIPIIRAKYKDVISNSIDVEIIASQLVNKLKSFDEFSKEMSIDWVWATSLVDGKSRLVPASMVFISDINFKGKFATTTSSGLSAGATIEDAILQGLLEIVEHDGCMICQSNKDILPEIKVDRELLKNKKLSKLLNNIEKSGYKVIHRDYTTDIGITTVRTWIINPNNYNYYATNGFGAALSLELALERSTTEAVQSMVTPVSKTGKIDYGTKSTQSLFKIPYSIYNLGYFLEKDIKNRDKIINDVDFKNTYPKSVKEAIDIVISRIKKAIPNADILFINLTRKEFEVPVVRVIVTDSIQRLNSPLLSVSDRLYGFSKNLSKYEDLYLGSYPH